MLKRASYLPFLLVLLLLSACTPKEATPPKYTTVEDMAVLHWKTFLQISQNAQKNTAPFSTVVNFRYKTPDEGHRLSAYLWGNGNLQNPFPLRMDMQTAAGNIAAKIKEEENLFMIYDTDIKEAYSDKNLTTALWNMGIPVPFSLSEITLLINAHYASFFFPEGQKNMPSFAYGSNDASMYNISKGRRAGRITIDKDGRPIFWEQPGGGWQMDLSYTHDSPQPGPRTIKILHPRGYSATLVVRNYTKPGKPFTEKQFDLNLPEGTKIIPLDPTQQQ